MYIYFVLDFTYVQKRKGRKFNKNGTADLSNCSFFLISGHRQKLHSTLQTFSEKQPENTLTFLFKKSPSNLMDDLFLYINFLIQVKLTIFQPLF